MTGQTGHARDAVARYLSMSALLLSGVGGLAPLLQRGRSAAPPFEDGDLGLVKPRGAWSQTESRAADGLRRRETPEGPRPHESSPQAQVVQSTRDLAPPALAEPLRPCAAKVLLWRIDESPPIHASEDVSDAGERMAVLELVLPFDEGEAEDVIGVELDRPLEGDVRTWCVQDRSDVLGGELRIPIFRRPLGTDESVTADLAGEVHPIEMPRAVRVLARSKGP